MLTSIGLVLLAGMVAPTNTFGASFPSSQFVELAAIVHRGFINVTKTEIVSMSDDPDGPVDVIVEGHARNRFRSWRLEVFRVEHNHLLSRWNSDSSVQGGEFDMVSETRIHVDAESKDYKITLSGCAQHLCSDGVSGFLLYLGRTSTVAKAKVVATDLTRSPDVKHTYEVTFSKGIDASSMETLKREICEDRTITTKSGLPFPC